jgi:hypothetical protein
MRIIITLAHGLQLVRHIAIIVSTHDILNCTVSFSDGLKGARRKANRPEPAFLSLIFLDFG